MDHVQFQVARKVLPDLPAEMRGWSVTGGGLALTMEGLTADGLISTRMSSFDAHDGMHLVIPVNNAEGGGYDIVCEVAGRFFRTGLDVTVDLAVVRVERRKPFRSEPRAALNELCLIRLTSSSAGALEFEGKIVDISAGGVGISTDRRLDAGDRLEIASWIGEAELRCTLIAVYTQPTAFGRYRTGCRISSVTRAGERLIANHVEAHGRLTGTPSLRRQTRAA